MATKIAIALSMLTITSALYTDVDETLDISKILGDPSKVRSYLDCFLDKISCTDKAASYKSHFNQIMDTACRDCDNKLKHMAEEFILDTLVNYPDDAALLLAKYDPDRTKFAKLASEVAKY